MREQAGLAATAARRVVFALTMLFALSAVPAVAQESVAEILSFLVTNQAVDTGDASRDRAAAEAASTALSRALLVSLSTLPITSSSGGFVYRFNPALGTIERASGNFAPLFVENALPAGEGAASVGLAFQFSRFTTLDGLDLRDGTLVTTSNRFVDESDAFDVETLTLRLRTMTATIWGTYGITDRLEVSAALPLVGLSLEGERVDTYRGTRYLQASAEVTSFGLGDVLVRGKTLVAAGAGGGVSIGGELRLPTGRSEDLTGGGSTGLRLFTAGSAQDGAISIHGQAGWGTGGVADQVDYAAALAVAVTPRVTVAGELLGRLLQDTGRLGLAVAPHPTISGVMTSRLSATEGRIHVARIAGGLKWNVTDSWLLTGSITLPVTDTGLSGFRPTIALEYAVEK